MHDVQNSKQGMSRLFNKLYHSNKQIIIAIALNLSIIFSLYRNVGQTLVFDHSMRVRLVYGAV